MLSATKHLYIQNGWRFFAAYNSAQYDEQWQ